jgi:glycerol-3-phosphate dehydrogenase (NAD+)
MKVVIFGSGSFGTAMATAVARNGHEVVVLSRSEEISAGINDQHKNLKYLTDFDLLPNISSTCDPAVALLGCDFIIHSVPVCPPCLSFLTPSMCEMTIFQVQASMQYLSARRDDIPAHVPIISTSKGLHSELLLTMNEIIPQALGREQPCAFLSGPSFAKEIMRDMPTAVVVASSIDEVAARVQALFKTDRMRVYTCKDVIGVEVGGALKNVFAIACGIAEGCGLGYNSAAALVTRGLSEMRKLALSMGAQEQTLSGLSGQSALRGGTKSSKFHVFIRCR